MPDAPTPDAATDAISLTGIVARHAGREGAAGFELRICALRVARGERVALLGPSGSGKSTLLGLIAGVSQPAAGRALVLGQDLAQLSGPARDRFRADHIGLIFQLFNLLPYASVADNVRLPLSFAAARRRRVDDPRAECDRLLDALDIPRDARTRPAGALSVGQQQRVAVARALIGAPEIVLADEPTSALDALRRDAFLDLLFAEAERAGASVVLVTHDPAVAERFERRIELEDLAPPEGDAAALSPPSAAAALGDRR